MFLVCLRLLDFKPPYLDLSSAQTEAYLPFIENAPNGSRAATQTTLCMRAESPTKANVLNSTGRFSVEDVGLRFANPVYRVGGTATKFEYTESCFSITRVSRLCSTPPNTSLDRLLDIEAFR